MGLTFIPLEVASPADPPQSVKVDCLVDSGTIYSVIPRAILEQLGIKPISRERFQLANGKYIYREKGIAFFGYDGKVGGSDVLFGEEGDAELCGAFTLEALGLGLDPIKRKLYPLQMML